MSLTYLGYSAFKFNLAGLCLYVDPFFKDTPGWAQLEPADLVLFSHGHFDHGVQSARALWDTWQCRFVAPRALVAWMRRKFRRQIPARAIMPLDAGAALEFGSTRVVAVPAHHPTNRLGKTILSLYARSSAPGNPVNGYYFDGYYHGGDTVYSSAIAEALKGYEVHTACLPIGGKYRVASPTEALRIAEEIGATRLVPMHWQPLMQQVPFRYRPSDLVRLAAQAGSRIHVCPLAIGSVLERGDRN